jgi:hypothetical protein
MVVGASEPAMGTTKRVDRARSRWLVPTRAVAIVAVHLLGALSGLWPLVLVYWVLVPWTPVAVHFFVHEPRRTRVALSFATGLASAALAFAVMAALVMTLVGDSS